KENDMTAKLTDDQMTAIREIHQRETPTAKQHFPAVRQAQTKLRQAVLNGADDATIQAKTADVQQLLAQGVDLRVRRLQEIAPLLTPEQRQKLATASSEGRWHRRRPRSESSERGESGDFAVPPVCEIRLM